MNDDTQQNKNHPFLLQSLIFIALETFLTFILKHDRMVRLHAKPFVQQQITILCNTFLPSDVFYVSFDHKGLLFDHEKPQHLEQPQITLYASGLDLFRALLTGNEHSINKIRLSGAEHLHEEFRLLLQSMSLPAILRDWKNWLVNDDHSVQLPKNNFTPLAQRIEQQRQEITKLTIQVKEYQYDLKTLERKHRLMSRVYWLLILILSISILSILWYNFHQ